jgi:hypothetical protein
VIYQKLRDLGVDPIQLARKIRTIDHPPGSVDEITMDIHVDNDLLVYLEHDGIRVFSEKTKPELWIDGSKWQPKWAEIKHQTPGNYSSIYHMDIGGPRFDIKLELVSKQRGGQPIKRRAQVVYAGYPRSMKLWITDADDDSAWYRLRFERIPPDRSPVWDAPFVRLIDTRTD